jgi:adenosylhomocysteine nucleosidase
MGKHDLVVAISGAGMQRAMETSEHLIKEFRPELVLSTGTCGGISADLKTGNLVIPHSVQYLSMHQADPLPYPAVEMDAELGQRLILARNRCGILGREGLLLTTDKIVRTTAEKRAIMDIPKATAVDMESAAVASAAADHGVSFGIVRAVSDPAWENLVVDYELMLKGKPTATPLDVLGYLATHPWQLGAFIKDVQRVFHASAVLKTYFRAFLEQQAMYASGA